MLPCANSCTSSTGAFGAITASSPKTWTSAASVSAFRGAGVATTSGAARAGRRRSAVARGRRVHRGKPVEQVVLEVGGRREVVELERREAGRDLERAPAHRRDARDAEPLGAAQDLEGVGGGRHHRPHRQPVRVDRHLQPERPEPRRQLLERQPLLGEARGDHLLQPRRALLVVEPDLAERRERRVEEAQVVVAGDREAGADDGLAGGGVEHAAGEGQLALERLPVRAEADRMPRPESFREAIWFSRSRGILPMMVCSPSPMARERLPQNAAGDGHLGPAHSPVKTGGRFSANAASASRRSRVPRQSW